MTAPPAGPVALVDAEARRRIRGDLDTTFIVEAAAGTGKTSELVARIVAVVRAGRATLARVVAVTFTDKAAGEMKLRLRGELERARGGDATPEERQRLDGAMAELEVARVGTIHSVCADLLRERPLEARVDPLFELAADPEDARILGEAFEGWFQGALASPPEGVSRILRRFDPRGLLLGAAERLVEHRDYPGPWRRDRFDRLGAMDAVVDALRGLAPLAARADRPQSTLGQSLALLARFTDELGRREAVRGRDHDGLEAELRSLARKREWSWRGSGDRYGVDLPRAVVLERRDAVKAQLDAFLARADADLAACLREELRPVVAAYERGKTRAGRLDFLDLLIRARDLLRDDAGVRAEMQARFTHIFVDEAQDIDPLQVEILTLLGGGVPGKLFLVGDPKQSIYRFRRADVLLYQAVKAELVAGGAEVLHLQTSFRAAPSIQSLVNAAFAPRMQGGGQAAYVPLRPFRADLPAQPAVVALPVPRPYGKNGVANYQIERSYPDAVAAFVDDLVRRLGWTVTERDRPGERVRVEPRHVGLLFRRFQTFGEDLTRPYVRALEARRIPHVLVGGRSFHEREEVMALRNALLAIERPDDELSVFAALRGPTFALGDDALLAFRRAHGTLHPVRWIEPRAELDELTAPVAEALAVLGRLHRARNRRPIAETIARLLAETRAHAGIAIWPAGEQALANVLRVLDLARRFEAAGATSFRAFCDRISDDAARGEAADAPVVEEGTEGVRIMTVHRAKGLELPVVILCDPTAALIGGLPSRHVIPERRVWLEPLAGCTPTELLENADEVRRRDEEEGVRLAYVAATRARDLLVVPVVGDEERPGWLEALHDAVHPEPRRRRQPGVASGCPSFGDDSVVERPLALPIDASGAVKPGAHAPRAGEHVVVWWDPFALRLDVVNDVGLRQHRMLEADDGGSAEAGVRAHDTWQAERKLALERGGRASVVVRVPSDLDADPAAASVPVLATTLRRTDRPHGKRFGALVHAVLAVVELDAGAEAVRVLAAAQARLVGAPDEEIAAAADAVLAALAHPLLGRAGAASELRREAPVYHREPDGALLEGVVDLAFREPDGWTVVDFKTDVELAGAGTRHAAQVAGYVRAVAAATGEPVRGVILAV